MANKKTKNGKLKNVDATLEGFWNAFEGAVDKLGSIELGGVRLDSGIGRSLLIIDASNLDEHVRIHGGLVTFWNSREAEAKEHLKKLQDAYDSWEKVNYRKIRNEIDTGVDEKPTIMDIRSEIEARYGKVRKKKLKNVLLWEKRVAILTAFCEGIRQKGFSLQQYSRLAFSEKGAQDSI